MATSTTMINYDPALKQLYRDSRVQKLTYTRNPMYAALPKFEGFVGRNMPVVLQYGNPQGVSRTFATAQANATELKLEDFLLTDVAQYSVATVDGWTIRRTKSEKGAFFAALQRAIDGAMKELANSIETKIPRSGTGAISQIDTPSVANPMVLTLVQVEEITCFEVNMEIECATGSATINAGDTGAALRATPASTTIAAVNRTAGTVTTDYNNGGGATNWAQYDWIGRAGDGQNAASALSCFAGFAAWLPSTAPASGSSFFGVDRSVDSRMYGIYHDGTGGAPLEEIFIDAQSKASREEGAPTVGFVHHAQKRRLVKEIGAKVEYDKVAARGSTGEIASIGFRSVKIDGDEGPINIVAASKCQARKAWLLTIEDWELATCGPAVQMLEDDNLRILRQAAADGYEVRLGSDGNISTKSPIWNVHIELPTP